MKKAGVKYSIVFLTAVLISTATGEDCKSTLAGGAVMCQIAGWQGDSFSPSDIDPSLCTHIFIAFGGLCDNGTVCSGYFSEHTNRLGYLSLSTLQNKDVQVGFVVGGWGEGFERFLPMIADAEKRQNFVDSVVSTMEKYNMTAVEIAWVKFPEYRRPEYKGNYATLIAELSNAIRPRGWQLGVTLQVSDGRLEETYDVETMTKYVDWFHVTAYDFHGNWEKQTGFNAPLFSTPPDRANVKFWIDRVVQHAGRRCVVMGLPMFGRHWQLKGDLSRAGPGSESTQNGGHMGYNQICLTYKNGGCSKYDIWDHNSYTPWAVCGSNYYSYESPRSIMKKVEFATTLDLAGVSAFTTDFDDHRNVCGEGRYPLLRAAQGIRVYEKPEAGTNSTSEPATNSTSTAVINSTVVAISNCTSGAGTNSTSGAGTNSTVGAGTINSTSGTGTNSTVGAGTNSTSGAGTDSTSGAGTNSTSTAETNEIVSGAEVSVTVVGAGNNKASGTNEILAAGANETTVSGTNETFGEGLLDIRSSPKVVKVESCYPKLNKMCIY